MVACSQFPLQTLNCPFKTNCSPQLGPKECAAVPETVPRKVVLTVPLARANWRSVFVFGKTKTAVHSLVELLRIVPGRSCTSIRALGTSLTEPFEKELDATLAYTLCLRCMRVRVGPTQLILNTSYHNQGRSRPTSCQVDTL